MATTQSDYLTVREMPWQLHRVTCSTLEAGSTTQVTHLGPSTEPPTLVNFILTTPATSGDPVFWAWTNPNNRTTKVVNVVFETTAGGDLTGAVGYLYFEFASSRTTTGGISGV
jgi:hypothetical protein